MVVPGAVPAGARLSGRVAAALLLSGGAALAAAGGGAPSPEGAPGILATDLPALVSRADIAYDAPAPRSEEGLPVGNGRMGSLVWTASSALRFQVNRVDVYPVNRATNSFFERHTDYCCGAGFVDVDVGGAAGDVFAAPGFSERLSVLDGVVTVESGAGLTARVLAWPEGDVLAIEVEDRRGAPQPIAVALRMLRFAPAHSAEHESRVAQGVSVVRTRSHTAASRLVAEGGEVALAQDFEEGEHRSRSALAIRVIGRPARALLATESEARLLAPAGPGRLTVLVGSAASFDPGEDVLGSARRAVEEAAARGFPRLLEESRDHWRRFWSRGFVHLESADGSAELVEQAYTYFLYLMASSSRGRFPPKFNGMLWNTGGDVRAWGSQHWFQNLSCYYEALPASGRLELMDPAFDMYSGMHAAAETAARQQWGSRGIFIPETAWFDGLAPLPDDVAAEMRELYLLRKPWEERSARFREYAATRHPHSSRWNWNRAGSWEDGRWVAVERGAGPFGPVTHILGTTAKVAYLYWRRYEYTRDAEWLRRRAYPMLRGAAEFYRGFPNLGKGPDGRYHLHHANSNESVWGARDTDEDLSALRGVLPALLRASELLGEDAELRPAWRELLDGLAPLPVSDEPEALKPPDYRGPRVFVRGRRPAVQSRGLLPDPNSLPAWFFDLCHPDSPDRETAETCRATFEAYFPGGITPETPVGSLSRLAIAAATLGRADAVRHLLPNQVRGLTRERRGAYRQGAPLLNRLSLREGHQGLDAQRLGRAAEALHLALLQSAPVAPAGEPVLQVFPAWPKEWDAAFTLLARGAFLVTSSMRGGRVELVELHSRAGSECRLRNPWGEGAVSVHRDGRRAESLEGGAWLRLGTRAGERLVIVPAGVDPASLRRRRR